MAAATAASIHAPLTAAVMVFELSGDYLIVLPLILATVVATVASKALGGESVYETELRKRGLGWEVPKILESLDDASSFYFDSASQILMPSWHRGRVVLVGDAAACPSLLSGQGSALAMVEALPFTYLHVFPYSARPDVAAGRLPGAVSSERVHERAAELRELGDRKAAAHQASRRGARADGIVSGRHGGRLEVLTQDYLTVYYPAEAWDLRPRFEVTIS